MKKGAALAVSATLKTKKRSSRGGTLQGRNFALKGRNFALKGRNFALEGRNFALEAGTLLSKAGTLLSRPELCSRRPGMKAFRLAFVQPHQHPCKKAVPAHETTDKTRPRGHMGLTTKNTLTPLYYVS